MYNKYLPIGSVVLLKEGNKPLMIYGRNQINGNSNKVFSYLACFYPEGNISSDYNIFFNRIDIEKVLFRGYETEEERLLRLCIS
jgi:hypothetical protein